MTLDQSETPALVLDRDRLDANLDRLATRLTGLGVRLRPHLKTAKAVEVARRAVAGQFGGIAVSTLAEAEFFAAAGFTDILYAVGFSVAKLPRLAALLQRGIAVTVILDHPETARSLTAAARAAGVRVPVLIECDTGHGRAGVDPDGALLIEIAGLLGPESGAELRGVLTHAGHAYAARGAAALAATAEAERAGAVRAAERLRACGYACPVVSVGSTPTACFGAGFAGVTEVRAGIYMFGDLFQAGLGTCGIDQIAVSVLATVIGNRPDRGQVLIDAGTLALSADTSPETLGRVRRYGRLADIHGRVLEPELDVAWLNQEHGVVPVVDPAQMAQLRPGRRVRVLPNHACITAALYDRYLVLAGGAVTGEWRRVNGW